MNREELKSKVEIVSDETGNGKMETAGLGAAATAATDDGDGDDAAAIEIKEGTFLWESDQVCGRYLRVLCFFFCCYSFDGFF